MLFDCIIPTAGKDCLLVKKIIPLIIKFLSPDKLYIITKKSYFIYFRNKTNKKIILIDEDQLIEGINYLTISCLLEKINYTTKNTGWYYQQFLKLGFSLSSFANKYYLSWDADTIPLKPISFFSETGTPYFTMKEEYHKAYFITIKKILGLNKICEKSFISENMMFDSEIVNKMIYDIECSNVQGENWCEKIINSMPANMNNSFSEFETYGTYVLSKFPNSYYFRELKSYRNAGFYYSRFINEKKLINLSKNYDMISLELRNNTKFPIREITFFYKIIITLFNKYLNWKFYK